MVYICIEPFIDTVQAFEAAQARKIPLYRGIPYRIALTKISCCYFSDVYAKI